MKWFETSGFMDEAVLREVKERIVPQSGIWQPVCFGILSLAYFRLKLHFVGAALLIMGIILLYCYLDGFSRVYIKKNMDLMRELNGVDKYQYTAWLNEEGLAFTNDTNHMEGRVLYADFGKVIETEHMFALITKRRYLFTIFKKDLDRSQQEELLAFIKDRCPKLKVKRLKTKNRKTA